MNIVEKLSELPADSYVEIYFEEDLFALFRLFDIFVHVPISPIREAFGQVYVDAMLSGLPTVITLSGIVHEYAKHKENAWVVDYQNSEQIAEGILALLNDKSFREKIAANGLASAKEYSIQNKMLALEELYVREFLKRTNKQ